MRFSARVQFYFERMARKTKIAKRKGIYRVAGLIRTASKRSMRLQKGPSTPGKPPHAHQGSASGLRAIFFTVDYTEERALIGPIKFPRSNFFDAPATQIQEFGGTYRSQKAVAFFPKRSYMDYTLKKLVAEGKIDKEFNVGMARVIGF